KSVWGTDTGDIVKVDLHDSRPKGVDVNLDVKHGADREGEGEGEGEGVRDREGRCIDRQGRHSLVQPVGVSLTNDASGYLGIEMGRLSNMGMTAREVGLGARSDGIDLDGTVNRMNRGTKAAVVAKGRGTGGVTVQEVGFLQEENIRLKQRVEELLVLSNALMDQGGDGGANGRSGGGTNRSTSGLAVNRGFRNEVGGGGGAGGSVLLNEAILRGQVAQLRRQVQLQWCAVDASSSVTREVKRVLSHLEHTLSEITSLGEVGEEGTSIATTANLSSAKISRAPSAPLKLKG
ncbi:unnamed protein product, partial [Choristocarpus tenellus]